MLWVWIGLIVVTAAVEAATVQRVTVWFAVGGVAGRSAYASVREIWLQILIFAIVSAVALAVTRPLVKKFTNGRRMPTNADRFIGEKAVVTEKIENDLSKGAVKIGGLEWTARSVDSETAEVGEQVTVEAIEGAKLIVRK